MIQEKYLPTIIQEVNKIRDTYKLNTDSPIGDYIFHILQNECIVIMYPEDKQPDLDGFSTEKVINNIQRTFVVINSSKNKEKQNFCAAHELGHRHKLDVQLKDAFPDDIFAYSIIEDVMNRFAAELMMPFDDFKKRGTTLYNSCLDKINNTEVLFVEKVLKAIVELMNFYFVPYKAVVIRMLETDVIPRGVCDMLQELEKTWVGRNVISSVIAERGITRLRIPDRKTQYSEPLENIYNIVKKESVSKYMNRSELWRNLRSMGIMDEDIQLIEDIRQIKEKTIPFGDKEPDD